MHNISLLEIKSINPITKEEIIKYFKIKQKCNDCYGRGKLSIWKGRVTTIRPCHCLKEIFLKKEENTHV